MKKPLTKKNLIILLGGMTLTLLLLLPGRFSSSCPKGKTYEPVLGGSCASFIDQNYDGVCDLVQGTTSLKQPTEFNFSLAKEAGVFMLFLIGAISLSILNETGKFLGKGFNFCRNLILLSSIFYFGFLLRQALCPIATLQMVFVSKERVVLAFFIFLVFLLPILTTLFLGRVFCRFLCPIGALQEFTFRIPRKFVKIPILVRLPRFLFYFPFLVLFLVALGSAFFSTAIFCKFDPFGSLFSCNPADWKVVVLAALLVTSLFIFRPFCQFLCPLGAIFKFLEKFRILRPPSPNKYP